MKIYYKLHSHWLFIYLFIAFCSTFFPLHSNNKIDYKYILDHPVIINLKRHIHRFEITKQFMEKASFTNIERYEAIDGFTMDDSFFESLGVFTGGKGQKGCAASHLLVWEDFLKNSEKEFLFIAEDDMLPHSDFHKLFPMYWQWTPMDFDIVLVGNQMKTKPSKFWIVKEPASCMHAYIISKKGAEKILRLYKQIPRQNTDIYVIDIFLGEMIKQNQISHYCYNGTPFPDILNIRANNISRGRNTGICFQNRNLGSSIHSLNIVP
ncbi:MAG: glycosyltransferase family 25 protein [Chlamydiales bacterium]|nr:glycosyltransferase family 25 protein [Chlamydiales bacterium]